MSAINVSVLRSSVRAVLLGTVLSVSGMSFASEANDASIARGEYLARVAGCNDCHTAGYPEAAGTIPMDRWLEGMDVGFAGPWGVSYPANLRLYFNSLDEQQWLVRARQPMMPPMPWFALRDMTDDDLLAIYRFVRSLGPSGMAAPAALSPGKAVATPYIEFFPKNLPQTAAAQ